MKIFAKRTKKTTVQPTEATPQKTFASDPVVQELLKKDPSEWNAKEKRMVQRYQKRMEESKNEEKETKEESDNQEEGKGAEETDKDKNDLELDSILEPSILEALNSKQKRKLTRTLAQKGKDAIEEVVQEATQLAKGTESPEKAAKAEASAEETATEEMDEMARVKEMLKGLNSKQKRTLSRRLEREGDSCLREVKAEAEKLLQADSEPPKEESTTALAGKKRKRRRGGAADWSGLTPEERTRRQEQQKMQKEAAERRANGEESSEFKHPLNSERRRANRRKPKWLPKRALENAEKVEHNSSGFQVRKFKKEQH